MATGTGAHVDDWDAVADGLDRWGTGIDMAFAERLLDTVPLGPGVSVLDVGCGTGALAIPAARRGADVLAVDLSPAMVARVRARAVAAGLPRLSAAVMDAETLTLDDHAVDVAVSMNGVSIVADADRAVAELVRVTRPGGSLMVAAYGPARRAEFLDHLVAAVDVAVGDARVFPSPSAPFQFADRGRFAAALEVAGARDVHVEALPWPMVFASAGHFWDVVTNCNPDGARLAAALTATQADDVRRVLDGMFRERSDGAPGAVLHAEVNVATATA